MSPPSIIHPMASCIFHPVGSRRRVLRARVGFWVRRARMERGFLGQGRGGWQGGGTVPVPWGHLAPSPRAGSLIKTAARAVAQLVPPASTRSGKRPPLAAPINGNAEPPRPGGSPAPSAPRCHLPGTLQPGWHRPPRAPVPTAEAAAVPALPCHPAAPALSTPRFWGHFPRGRRARCHQVPPAVPGLWERDRRGDPTPALQRPRRAPGWGQGPAVPAVAAGTGAGTAPGAGTSPSLLPRAQLSQGAGGPCLHAFTCHLIGCIFN